MSWDHAGNRQFDNTPIKPSKAWGYLNTALLVILLQAIIILAGVAALFQNQC